MNGETRRRPAGGTDRASQASPGSRATAEGTTYPQGVQLILDPDKVEAPGHTRATDTPTATAAGSAPTGPKALARSELRRQILTWLEVAGPQTDDELCRRLPAAHPGSVAKRRHDLVRAGLVEPTDTTRRTRYGSQAIVWRAVPR